MKIPDEMVEQSDSGWLDDGGDSDGWRDHISKYLKDLRAEINDDLAKGNNVLKNQKLLKDCEEMEAEFFRNAGKVLQGKIDDECRAYIGKGVGKNN